MALLIIPSTVSAMTTRYAGSRNPWLCPRHIDAKKYVVALAPHCLVKLLRRSLHILAGSKLEMVVDSGAHSTLRTPRATNICEEVTRSGPTGEKNDSKVHSW